ncbi:MAG TPA: hypothetical protein VMZ53_23710, partial [Kofleriaceae bacterium]|nr:hypothetical protein [Kofleriaceae bacterium]
EPVRRTSVTRGMACNQGTFRVEETDAAGTCTAVVAGTLIARERTMTFIPDVPWVMGKRYKLTLVSGTNDSCDAGELCDPSSALSFDPLAGLGGGDGGGPALTMPFTGGAPSKGTYMMNTGAPATDVNGNGVVDSSEQMRTENRAAMHITSTTGSINSATFNGNTCGDAAVDNKKGCTYLVGAMPVVMGEATTTCPLPGGATAATCIPVQMSAQTMFGTSITMAADIGLTTISTATGTQIMRIRQGTGGQVMGYIIDNGGTPKIMVALDLYMDAPDMSVTLSSHDLHSKQLSLVLEGPVTFLDDGRISIALSNTADVPVDVSISGPASGHVKMSIPKGEMNLQLVSPAPRGVSL